jgi:hypothetical protein
MKQTVISFAAAALLAFLTGSASAAVIFSDNFNGATPGGNQVPPGWTVTNGNVDVLGVGPNGSFADFLPGNGYYIDLDGSAGGAGVLRTAAGLSLTAGTAYTLTFSLAGSQRGSTESVLFGIDLNSDTVLDVFNTLIVQSSDPFTTRTLNFTPLAGTSNARIVFNGQSNDNVGALLDNVALNSAAVTAVDEPGMLGLLTLSLMGLALTRRRTRRS